MITLNEEQIDLLFYCLEQMESDFTDDEVKICDQIVDVFTDAQVEMNSYE